MSPKPSAGRRDRCPRASHARHALAVACHGGLVSTHDLTSAGWHRLLLLRARTTDVAANDFSRSGRRSGGASSVAVDGHRLVVPAGSPDPGLRGSGRAAGMEVVGGLRIGCRFEPHLGRGVRQRPSRQLLVGRKGESHATPDLRIARRGCRTNQDERQDAPAPYRVGRAPRLPLRHQGPARRPRRRGRTHEAAPWWTAEPSGHSRSVTVRTCARRARSRSLRVCAPSLRGWAWLIARRDDALRAGRSSVCARVSDPLGGTIRSTLASEDRTPGGPGDQGPGQSSVSTAPSTERAVRAIATAVECAPRPVGCRVGSPSSDAAEAVPCCTYVARHANARRFEDYNC